MLKVDHDKKTLEPVQAIRLAEAKWTERHDLQRMIRTSPEAFFKEIGERLLLIGEEVQPSHLVADRIDLLAIDDEGRTVVIELKRGSDRLQLLQALSYAAMLSGLDSDYFLEFDQFCPEIATRGGTVNYEDALREHIGPDLTSLNHEQRVILIAEEFDWEVLATAEWLSEKHNVDIRCFRIALSSDAGSHYLSCTCIYPPPELEDYVRTRGTRPARDRQPKKTWEQIVAGISNPDVMAFFKSELEKGVENRPTNQDVAYRDAAGRRRYWVAAFKKRAYVSQQGRFEDDIGFWLRTLGADCDPKPIFEGTVLRFYLATAAQFEAFTKFLAEVLPAVEFNQATPEVSTARANETS
jgi:hypothetical protein